MSEKSTVEAYGARRCKELGLWALKLAVIAGGGWPDHTIIGPAGRVCMIEYKIPGGKFQPLQPYYLMMLTKFGFIAEKCETREEIDDLLERFMNG